NENGSDLIHGNEKRGRGKDNGANTKRNRPQSQPVDRIDGVVCANGLGAGLERKLVRHGNLINATAMFHAISGPTLT
ncbi:MAG: hypothetical protein ACXWJ8_13225, partial [Xanthobacteraceae bacterium]